MTVKNSLEPAPPLFRVHSQPLGVQFDRLVLLVERALGFREHTFVVKFYECFVFNQEFSLDKFCYFFLPLDFGKFRFGESENLTRVYPLIFHTVRT